MTSDEILALVAEAFADAPRPDVFTSECSCGECTAVNASLQSCSSELPSGLAWELSLLSPSAVRYLTPALIQNCLSEIVDDDLGWNFISMVGTPISKTDPPDSLPFAGEFDWQQCTAVLVFLRYVLADWYNESEPPPREVLRGLHNWEHFVECAASRTT